MESQYTSSSLTEKLTLFFMIAAVFASVAWGLESWFEAHIGMQNTEIREQRGRLLENIAARTDPALFVIRSILPVLRQVSENPQLDLEALRNHHLQQNHLNMTLYLFDAAGALVKTSPARAGNLWLMRNLYPVLKEQDIRKVSRAAKSLDKKIEFAFGFGKDLNSIRENPETIINTASSGKEGMLAWTTRPSGGLIIVCQEAPDQQTIFAAQTPGLLNDPSLVKTGLLQKNSRNLSLPEAARKAISQSGSTSGVFAGLQWHFVNTRSARTLFAAFKLAVLPMVHARYMLRLLLAALLAAIFIIFSFAGAKSAITLKKLVISMFLASSLIPLSGIAFTTIDNLDVFSQIHTNKLRAAKEEALSNMIQNFNKYLASCSANLVQLTQNPGEGGNDLRTHAMNKAITDIFPEARVTLRNAGAELTFLNAPDFSYGRETVFKSIARRLVERYVPERLNEHKYSGNLFSDSLVRKDDMGFGTLQNSPGRLQFINTGNADMLLFYRLLPATAGTSAVAQVELSTFASVRRYLREIRETPVTIDNARMLIAAFYPRGYRWSRPPIQQHQQQMLNLAEIAHVTGKAQFRRFTGRLNGFALCIPSPELAGNCIIAFSSAEPLDQAISAMQRRIIMGAMVALVLLISVGVWISRQLIAPLGQLETGMHALAQRNFEARLTVPPGKDEVSILFNAFNDMMSESYDMQIAHSVQEGLVPDSFPEIPGYSAFGMLQAASDLGGDCLDCFKLPDGKVLFLVGDLTGHGVGSALMMAFARAVTFHWSQGANLSPASLTDQIDSMLRENRTERMFMGIICGVLDPQKNEVELVTKGHIYPLKVNHDRTFAWQGMPAYPLGIARQQQARSLTFSMHPGDGLLCMTDGFLEAHNKQLRTIGFDGIESWACETVHLDAREQVFQLEARFRNWCSDRQSDDISIFALKRHPGETANVS